MIYRSTRGSEETVSASEAILKGIAVDGGLYVPEQLPSIDDPLHVLAEMSYKQLACLIMGKYLTDFEPEELQVCADRAYGCKFDTPHVAPLVEKAGVHFLELHHGPTLAFKDLALTILPHLMKAALEKHNPGKEVVILTATSGDTGKAALEGFANVEGTKVIVFFPEDGVSDIQKLQMLTQEGSNTFVAGIDGNFDDAQSGVKEILNDRMFKERLGSSNYMLSSANSINMGRLIPQIVYYFYAYLTLVRERKIKAGEAVNTVVPTGNFGNILAAYYARKMGLPLNKLICASNENNVLYHFLQSGIYDSRRELKLTSSPSMDILISSNLERLLYEISGRDSSMINMLMSKLVSERKYEITEDMKKGLAEFYGGYASELETSDSIRRVFETSGYVMDTHTAVAYAVYEGYKRQTNDKSQAIIVSTASPFKFGRTVGKALGINTDKLDDFSVIKRLSASAQITIPKAIKELETKRIIHGTLCRKHEMKLAIQNFLKV
ncbi:MAG TPA: threonine synthase [Clostridia bacterium]|nr:threonine synthase [Clostridia bacterium]